MTKDEKRRASMARVREVGRQTSDGLAMMGGGYAAGRFMRNSHIGGFPLSLALGVGVLFMNRRARSGVTRTVVKGALGAGAYGAGKLGEQHGQEAGNDGNLFSWDNKKGVTTD